MNSPTPRSPAQMPDHAVETEGLVKVYRGSRGEKRALDGVSLAVPRGSFFGLLGPNGAGKSTFINILAGLVVKTSGTAKVWGRDLDMDQRGAKAAIGVVPQELNLDPFFTPLELLDVQAGMYGVPKSERRTMEILEAVGLADKAGAYARTLSGGMRRRLLVAKAMVHSPPVLVLDEPTAGVDIELRQQLWAYVRELNARGTTILLTTHYLEEAEQLCDRIAIINHGKLVACDTTPNLLKRIDGKALTITVDRDVTEVPAPLVPFAPELKDGRRVVVRYRPSAVPIGHILAAFGESGLAIMDLSTEETDLEDIFLQLTSSKT
ncbi:multidrug ABC transporter ATP-binding protein [Paramagnetospirillum kuznetsovii]|uniref:Multidrug ABC transporter ATP-binding protein n=1 Tax=Paramagnetospirillum kuznetsovii TaxID=2053833 RepID=A0A364P074_9PROT|nr:ABC transporter ATP-binding protein [Paramagnetospirillum kuznetsovii]RAU22749.1 multidrug ABC transporter ATP-binding protein [Paramagnetospirillum kuznetsovii]